MSEILPTTRVKFKEGGFVATINQSDFNEQLHERVDGAPAPETSNPAPAQATMTKEQVMARLKELNVDFKPTQKKDELEALLAAEEAKLAAAPASQPALTVQAKDDKFIIVNVEGVQQGGEFDTEQAAKDMAVMLGGAA